MPTVLLLRHAKSSWADPSVADRDRPLNERGERAARRMARYLQTEGIGADLVLCSPAVRTTATLGLVRPALGEGTEVRLVDKLYGATATEILDQLRAVGEDTDSVMVVSHNPGLHDLGSGLAGDGDEAALTQLRRKLPTGALVCLDTPAAWAELDWGQTRLTRFVLPRELPD